MRIYFLYFLALIFSNCQSDDSKEALSVKVSIKIINVNSLDKLLSETLGLINFSADNPLNGKIEKKGININGSSQIEGIAANPDGSYYMTAEEVTGFTVMLYKFSY